MWKWGGKVLGSDGSKTRPLDTHGHCQLQRAGEQGVRGALCLSVSPPVRAPAHIPFLPLRYVLSMVVPCRSNTSSHCHLREWSPEKKEVAQAATLPIERSLKLTPALP